MLVGYGIAAVRTASRAGVGHGHRRLLRRVAGLAATLATSSRAGELFSLEAFLFGDPLLVRPEDVIWLAVPALAVVVVLTLTYNSLLLSGFNSSLALSRQVPVADASYAFIMLLAVVVTLSVRTVACCSSTPAGRARRDGVRPAQPAATVLADDRDCAWWCAWAGS